MMNFVFGKHCSYVPTSYVPEISPEGWIVIQSTRLECIFLEQKGSFLSAIDGSCIDNFY